MSALAVLPAADLVEQSADPATYVIEACERAKTWLAHALAHGGIEDIVELKSQAEAIRVYTMQKQLGKDAEIAASEVVRRAERGIGLAIRKGQEAGEIRRQYDPVPGGGRVGVINSTPSPVDVAREDKSTVSSFYAVTDDVSDEQFETALSIAKDEGNLSRANVVKTVKVVADPNVPLPEEPAEQAEVVRAERKRRYDASDRPEVLRRMRRLDPHRVITETVIALDGLATGLGLLTDEHYDGLDRTDIEQWSSSLSESMRSLNRLSKKLKELNRG